VSVLGIIGAPDRGTVVWSAVPLVIIAAWLVFDRWALAYWSTRSYARAHALCIPRDQVRVLSADSIEARCTTSDVSVRWSGIIRVTETPEFYLFFTTPTCAIQLPRRAVPDGEQLRLWLSRRGAQAVQTATPV
jgi:hypothetical protein